MLTNISDSQNGDAGPTGGQRAIGGHSKQVNLNIIWTSGTVGLLTSIEFCEN